MNLDEVARRAKVSTATVSRVLNNATPVRESTRARVVKAIDELKYHPNLHARTLAGGQSRTIGVITSNLANPFFFDIFQKIEREALPAGYEVVVANTDYIPERLLASVRLMIGRRVAGLAVMVSEMDPGLIDTLMSYEIPSVFFDVGRATDTITRIRVDYSKGIQELVRYLRSLGHARLAFIGHHAMLGPTSARHHTFMEIMSRYGPAVQFRTVVGSDTLEGGQSAARELLDTGFRPTAIVCVNDFMAVGAMRELRERGLRVPEDVSVTGFDDIAMAEFCSPMLTTARVSREAIGGIAIEHLLRSRDAESSGADIVIDPELVIRASTGPAAETR